MKFVKNTFFTILVLLIFMQGFIIPIPQSRLAWGFVSTIVFLIICFFINAKVYVRTLLKLYKYSPVKYLTYFYAWIALCGFIFILLGKIPAGRMIYFIIRFILFTSVYLILPVFINKFISLKKIIRIMIIVLYLIMGFALFQFVGEICNIPAFRDIVNFFSNYKFEADLNTMKDAVTGRIKIRSVFSESQFLAVCMCFMFPVVYSVVKDGCKVFRSVVVNKIVRISIIPLMWFILLIAQSPVYFIFSVIVTAIYWLPKLLKKTISIYMLAGGFTVFLVLTGSLMIFNPDAIINIIENSFLARIFNAFTIFNNFDEFVTKEGSLAVRVVFQINQFLLFLHVPITGVGIGCSKLYLYNQLLHSPVTVPYEIQEAMAMFGGTSVGVGGGAGSCLTMLLVDTGIIGTVLYYIYLLKNVILLNKIKLFYRGIEYSFVEGLSYTCAMIILFSFYNNSLDMQFVYFWYGIMALFCVRVHSKKIIKIINKKEDNDNESN